MDSGPQLETKVALVTGGTGALGKIICSGFIQSGCKTACTYLHEESAANLDSADRERMLTVRADVTDEADVYRLFQSVFEEYHRIDILVNCAGGYAGGKYLRDVDFEEWNTIMAINLDSVFLCSREYLRLKTDYSYGRIVNIAAQTAFQPVAGKTTYITSKAAIVALTAAMGEELRGTGITANAIAPSIIKTPSNMKNVREGEVANWVSPEDIRGLVFFLCSEEGRAINGKCIPMYGGV